MSTNKSKPDVETLIAALRIINKSSNTVADALSRINTDRPSTNEPQPVPRKSEEIERDNEIIENWIKAADNEDPYKVAKLVAWYIAKIALELDVKTVATVSLK